MPALRIDAHFTVIESALKGYVQRRTESDTQSPEQVCIRRRFSGSSAANLLKEQQRTALEADMESWCNLLLDMKMEVRV